MAPPPPMRPMMAPDAGKSIRLGNLDKRVTEDLLWELFVQAGPVMSVVLPKVHTGFAMVEFQSMIDAVYAMVVMNNVALFGKPMDVYHHYKEQYLLEEQEQMRQKQHKFYQAPQHMMKKSMNPDPSLLKKSMTPEQASSFGLAEASSCSDSEPTDDEDDEGKLRDNEPPLEEEPIELPSWMVQRSDGSFAPVPRVQDKYTVRIAPSLDQEPMAIPPPPPPRPPTVSRPGVLSQPAIRTPLGLPPPPPIPGGIMRVTTPMTPPPYSSSSMRYVTPPATPARPGMRNGGLPTPPPPPSANRYPRSYGSQY